MNIDHDKLRRDLAEYYGKKLNFDPCAIFKIAKVQNASNDELEDIARENGFDLNKYYGTIKIYRKH